VLFIVELLEGTSFFFALCGFLFIFIATVAFNLAGGFTRPTGAYVFFYAVLAVIVGLIWKAYLGEPADSNLETPRTTIMVFLGGISAMLAAVFVSRKLTTKQALIGNRITDVNMRNAATGCMLTGFFLSLLLAVVPHADGSVLSAVAQINRFLPLAIILGTISEIRRSSGTRSVNLTVLLSGAAIFAQGILSYGKEGMFLPLVCWLIAAASQRYKLSFYQLIGGVIWIAFMFYYLVPYSQYGRNFRDPDQTLSENLDTSISLLSNLEDVRQNANSTAEEMAYSGQIEGYFNTPQGVFERLQMLAPDDALIAFTEREGKFGLMPILFYFQNLIPHFIWPNKPMLNFGNQYAHQIGNLAEDDTTTGISFSPSGEAFHLAGYTGVLLVAPILWIALFTLFDSLCGDIRRSPWGLLMIAVYSHTAPEGALASVVGMLLFATVSLLTAALAASYVMPILGILFGGSGRITIAARLRPARAIPRRFSPRRLSASPSSEGIGS
jgi:hypothetical protein